MPLWKVLAKFFTALQSDLPQFQFRTFFTWLNVWFSGHVKCGLTSNHDANVFFGIDVPYGQRTKIIQRHKSYLKIQDGRHQIQDGRRRPSWKTTYTHRSRCFWTKNYCNICFLCNLRLLNSFLTSFLYFMPIKMYLKSKVTKAC